VRVGAGGGGGGFVGVQAEATTTTANAAATIEGERTRRNQADENRRAFLIFWIIARPLRWGAGYDPRTLVVRGRYRGLDAHRLLAEHDRG
jgi:hypothetical protein